MFHLLGYNPAWTQVLYRIGDSCTNVASPLNTYQPIILTYLQEYDEEAGMGTLISLMLPYTFALLITWVGLAIVWYMFNLPLGVGGQILM